MRRREKIAIVLSGILLGAGAVLAPAAAADDQEPTVMAEYTIGQFNMAGGHKEHGKKGNEAPDALIRSVEDRKPAFMTVQEACQDWNARLEEKLPDYVVVFQPILGGSGEPSRCYHGGTLFGNALLARKDLGFDKSGVADYDLQSPQVREPREHRKMLCLKSEPQKTVACSAHLSVGNDSASLAARRGEAARAAGIIAGNYADYKRFLGGDLNDDPLSGVADNFYHPGYGRGAHGDFKEADSPCGNQIKRGYVVWSLPPVWFWCRSGEDTHSQGKLDFLFTPPTVHVTWSDATHAKHSDHSLLWAGVEI
ncbi:endonuclease/exonuclease/phosphatase family protein [Streptomyces sp. 796.1]|uniref:endonuclease/exonuclease/phosphatase family protein n=1 Tax=Streptomyces sp. 796.1 TaxID=3163029 RepID=UPI0039C8F0B7